MNNNNIRGKVEEAAVRLKQAGISLYKISADINEPKSTIQNLFSGQSKYSKDRAIKILDKINSYLDTLEETNLKKKIESDIKIPTNSDCPEIFSHYELYIRLFELGLNAKSFNPEEKLRFAIWHRTLTAFKKNMTEGK